MAIDMSKMKAKLDQLNNKGSGGANYFKMELGNTYEVRILPTPDGDPFKQYFVHYRVGNAPPFLSPKRNFGEDDALDRFVRKLYDEGSDESRQMARDLSAKARFFSPVIVRGQEENGPMVWSYSKTVYEEKLYPETSVRPRPKASPLSKDENQVEGWLANLPDIDAMQNRKTPEEVEEILNNFLMSDGADAEELASETTRVGGGSRVANALADLV
jgi:hypothetical protein